MGGVFTKLIEANTTIPTKKSETFSTAEANQPAVEINVLQGERAMAKDNRAIGKFTLDGIPPAPRGVPQIEVTFDVDANGIIKVSAKDKGTGKAHHIRIESKSGLSDAEIKRMKEEALANVETDKKAKEEVEKLNLADSLIFSSEKQIKEYGDKIPADKKDGIVKAVANLREAHTAKDVAKIDTCMTELNSLWQAASEEMYKEPQAENAEQPKQEGEENKSEHVTDAD